jgi:hypothetical protein
MSLLRTLWLREIKEQIFASNMFLKCCLDWDEYVREGILDVIIPQAGLPAGYVRNRQTVPATIERRIDGEIKYSMVDYTIDPRLVTQLEQKQLNYDKLASEIRLMLANVKQGIALDVLYSWRPELTTSFIETTGDAKPTELDGATGNRKMPTLNDIIDANTLFNKQDIDSEGRKMMLPATMYGHVLKDKDLKNNFDRTLADQSKGILGKLAGFEIMTRSSVLNANQGTGTIKLPGSTVSASDSQCGIFWHPDYVGASVGNIEIYADAVVRPEMYGRVTSGQAQAGGSKVFKSQIGVGAIIPVAA